VDEKKNDFRFKVPVSSGQFNCDVELRIRDIKEPVEGAIDSFQAISLSYFVDGTQTCACVLQ